MAKGTIKKLVSDKGFGFISVDQNKKNDVFFHATGLDGCEFDELEVGDSVSFDTEKTDKGLRAVHVRVHK